MFSVSKKFFFEAAHMLRGHEGLCANMHGHNYGAEVTVACDQLDPIGRVLDFSELKSRVGGWLDEHWDHAFLHHEATVVGGVGREYSFGPVNPTAERMAQELFELVRDVLPRERGLRAVRATIIETPGNSATYEP